MYSNIIGTIEELKEDLYSCISDMSKEANGCRVRYNYKACTVEQLMADYDFYSQAADHAFEQEKVWQGEAKADFEANINACIELGAGDRVNAMRWLLDAELADGTGRHDLREFFWGMNLSWNDNDLYRKEFAALENHNQPLEDVA